MLTWLVSFYSVTIYFTDLNMLSVVARERFQRYLSLKSSIVAIKKNVQDLQLELQLAMQEDSSREQEVSKRRKSKVTQDQVIDQLRWKVSSVSEDHCFTVVTPEVKMDLSSSNICRWMHTVHQKLIIKTPCVLIIDFWWTLCIYTYYIAFLTMLDRVFDHSTSSFDWSSSTQLCRQVFQSLCWKWYSLEAKMCATECHQSTKCWTSWNMEDSVRNVCHWN